MFPFVGGGFDATAPGAIGGTTPAAGTFTSLNATGATTLDGNVAIGNAITDLIGMHGATAVDQGAALTAQLTSITITDAAGTEVEQRLEEKGFVASN